jgi:acyl-CoA thioesterase-2
MRPHAPHPVVRFSVGARANVWAVDTQSFLGLDPTHNRFRWKLPVTPGICTAGNFMYGGAGLGSAIAALEGTSGRRTIWATAQYLTYARPGEVLDIDVTLVVEGHQMTQARAVCHVEDREILTVNAALGSRPFEAAGQFEQMPADIPPPEQCQRRVHRLDTSGYISDRMDERLVGGRDLAQLDGTLGSGRTLMWARIPEVLSGVDGAALGVLGDFVPFAVGQALWIQGGGNSLDNTLRIVDLVPTEWVLLDIRVHGVERGFGHGLVNMFAEDGTLLAVASQSCIVRLWKAPDAVASQPAR